MAQNAHLLNNMNLNPETLELAKAMLREATVKTKPGSGFELGSRTTGLPAICAYIACQRLKTNELTRKTTQIASCLKDADFEKAFHIVEAAIGGNRPSSSKVASYKSICSDYNANESQLAPFFRQTEHALLRIDGRYNSERMVEVRYSIFFWVYYLWKSENVSPKQFSDDNKLSYKTFKAIVTTLEAKCKTLRAKIIERAKSQTNSPTKTMSTPSNRSRLKQPLRDLPSRDFLQKRRLTSPERATLTDQPTLDNLTARPFPETPTKKRKLENTSSDIPQKPAISTPLKSILRTSPRKGSTISTPSRVKLDVTRFEREDTPGSDVEIGSGALPAPSFARGQSPPSDGSASGIEPDSADELDIDNSMIDDVGSFLSSPSKHRTSTKAGPASIRRFRPVYLDLKQWKTLDPRLQAIYTRS
ncbi:hypothetical protein APHAL10511_002768 [Amanita phalloides]|nr:hypothetical protein APHAL10511_002768 [Amanita phalloides]